MVGVKQLHWQGCQILCWSVNSPTHHNDSGKGTDDPNIVGDGESATGPVAIMHNEDVTLQNLS